MTQQILLKSIQNPKLIEEQFETLNQGLFGVHHESPEARAIDVILKKGTFDTLSNLVKLVDVKFQKELQPLIAKVQRKLDLAQRVVIYIQANSPAVDPRIEKALAKLAKVTTPINSVKAGQDVENLRRKLEKCNEAAQSLRWEGGANDATKDAIAAFNTGIDKLRVQLLKAEPLISEVRSLFRNDDVSYAGLDNVPACKALSGTGIAMHFLRDKLYYDKFEQSHTVIAGRVINDGHKTTAEFIKASQTLPQSIGLNDLLANVEGNRWPKLVNVPVSETFRKRHPEKIEITASSDKREILNTFGVLDQMRADSNLSSMGVLLTIGDQQIPMTFHSGDVITLFDLAGNEASENRPYQITFASPQQATEHLSKLIAGRVKEKPALATSPANLQCVCNEAHLLNARQEQERVANDGFYIELDDETLQNLLNAPGALQAFPGLNVPPLPGFGINNNDSLLQDLRNLPIFLNGPQNFVPQAPNQLTIEEFLPPGLATVVNGLSQKNEEGFFLALGGMAELTDAIKSEFPMSDNTKRIVRERLFFHLYHIHDKESPQKVDRKDVNYGLNAFQDERSTPEEKYRAAQRTQIELMLDMAKQMIENEDDVALRVVLGALEKRELDPRDLRKNGGNTAHYLFSKLYELYKADAEKPKSTLEHPHSNKFKGDFGRNGFNGTGEVAVPRAYQIKALQELTAELKATWKI
jgi:hypothetical protein